MDLYVTGKHLELTAPIREQIERRAEKFPKYYERVSRVDAVAEKRGGHTYFVEFVVHVPGNDPIVATAKDEDLYACIDGAGGKAEHQLRNFHAKLVDHKH